MGGDDDSDATLRQRGDRPPEGTPCQRVDAAGRFVEEQDFRLVQQASGHCQALLVAAGEQAADRHRFQPEFLDSAVNALAQHLSAQPVGATEELQVLAHGQVAVQREFLRHVADAPTRLRARRAQVESSDLQMAAGGWQQPAQHAECRGLARAIGAEQTEYLAAAHLERCAGNGGEVAELAYQIADHDHRPIGIAIHDLRVRRCSQFRRLALVLLLLAQHHHESVFEFRRAWLAAGIAKQLVHLVGGGLRLADEVNRAALGNRIDDQFGGVDQSRL